MFETDWALFDRTHFERAIIFLQSAYSAFAAVKHSVQLRHSNNSASSAIDFRN